MPEKKPRSRPRRQPSYRLHKARGCAVVTINGRNQYLGKYDSPESHEKYARLIAQWQANGGDLQGSADPQVNGRLTVAGLILKYMEHAQQYYKKYDTKHQGEVNNLRHSLRPLNLLYGRTLSQDFSPAALEAVRQSMVESGLARNTINQRVAKIKRAFRWAASKGLVPPTVYHGLGSVEGLRRGRTAARETERVKPVPEEHVDAACQHLNRHVRAMVEVQELAGMRPQDIWNLRTGDLDRSRDVWVYEPTTHKMEHLDHVRQIAIGPKAQALLAPFLKPDKPTAFVFSPKEAAEAVLADRRDKRKTPLTPSQRARSRKRNPKRRPGDQYTKNSYRSAIVRACDKADVPRWHPHQLRHNCGTKVRRLYGLDGAAAVLGHKFGTVTEIYAELDIEKAIEIMREIG